MISGLVTQTTDQQWVTRDVSPKKIVLASKDLLCQILIDFPAAQLVCKSWRRFIIDFLKPTCEINSPLFAFPIKFFALSGLSWSFPSACSPWCIRPNDWHQYNGPPLLTCIKLDLVAFQPKNMHSHLLPHQIDIFPHLQNPPFNGNCQLLGFCNGTYVFQSFENFNRFKVVSDISSPETWRDISLNVEISEGLEKRTTFVVSEERMVFITSDAGHSKLIRVNLNNGSVSTDTFLHAVSPTFNFNNFLLWNNQVIDLNSNKIIPQKVNIWFSSYRQAAAYNSTLYLCDNFGIVSMSLDGENQFKTNWTRNLAKITDSCIGVLNVVYVEEVICNDKYMVYRGIATGSNWSIDRKSFHSIHLLDIAGNPKGEIVLPILDKNNQGCTKTHLLDDVLIYNNSVDNMLIFWDIPNKNCISKIALNDRILDIQSTDHTLIVLTAKKEGVKESYRTVEFNLTMLKRYLQNHMSKKTA